MTLTQILLLFAAIFATPHIGRKGARALSTVCLVIAFALIVYTGLRQ